MIEKREERGGISYRYVKRRNLTKIRLKIKPDGVVEVSIPYALKFEDAMQYARKNEAWIASHMEGFHREERSILRGGEKFIYFGKEYPFLKKSGTRYAIKREEDSVVFVIPENGTPEKTEKFIKEWFRKAVREVASAKLKEWENKTGLRSTALKIKYTSSMWGSCTYKNVISVSAYIAEKPLECLDYLIVHELVHTQIKGHGKDFYDMVGKFYPDWQKARRILKYK